MKKVKIYKKTLTIRLSDEQHEEFQKLKKSGYSVSDLIRQSLAFYKSLNADKTSKI